MPACLPFGPVPPSPAQPIHFPYFPNKKATPPVFRTQAKDQSRSPKMQKKTLKNNKKLQTPPFSLPTDPSL
jgi:hypothetical protein